MWNNWVEKAKGLAQNIDQQLNEAVGADADPNNPVVSSSSSLTAPATATGPGGPLTSTGSALFQSLGGATKITGAGDDSNENKDDDDAWNDDFDFGDDDDEDGEADKNDKKVTAPPPKDTETDDVKPATDGTSLLITVDAEAAADGTPPLITADSDVDAETGTVDCPFMATGANDVKTERVVSAEIVQEEREQQEHITTPALPTESGRDKDFNSDQDNCETEVTDADATDLPTSKTESENDDIKPESVCVTHEDSSSPEGQGENKEPSNDSPLASSLMDPSTDATLDDVRKNEDDNEISQTPNGDASDQSTREIDDVVTEVSTAQEQRRPLSLFSNLAHRVEGLAQRAEGITHQAEGGVSSLLAAASQLGDTIVQRKSTYDYDDDDDDANVTKGDYEEIDETDKQMNNPRSGAVSNLLTVTLNGMATAVVDDSIKNDSDEHQGGAWDGDDDDLEITENEGGDGAAPVPEKVRVDEGQDNLQVDPCDKAAEYGVTSTDEDVAESAKQSTTEETTSFVSLSGPESVLIESTEASPPSSDPCEPAAELPISNVETSFAVSSTVPTAANIEEDPRYVKLQEQLRLREDQLVIKSEQLNELQILLESQAADYKKKLSETKEEAKKRIQRAKERCDAAEAKLQMSSTSVSEDFAKQAEIIKALREEGQALALKQAAMEQAVRAAKAESRQMVEQLEDEASQKEQALEKIKKLEMELKITKDSLSAARKGESQAGKLESDLLAARSDAETKATTILSLQQQIKELTKESKELRSEIESTRKAAAHEAQQEKSTLRREHNDIISDLETKLRATEREAGVREDALRHEVNELRKRWQDAVRRADALSMDIQSSTAPLLRQLESMERQNRARAANWAELEGRLRHELEESVIQNDNLTKDRSEFKAKISRLERLVKERDDDLAISRKKIEDQTIKIEKMATQLSKLESEAAKRQEEYEKVERLANEGVARVRSEMTQTVVESEERYRGQIDRLEVELQVEKEKRLQLEAQVDQLLENAGGILGASQSAPQTMRKESKPKKLRESEGQAEILADALGLDDSDDDLSEYGASDDELDEDIHNGVAKGGGGDRRGGSFAALEQLTSRLKTAEVELKSLRRSLRDSEATRDSLVEELADTRHAKEKLPLFEAKVKELTEDNREKELEIMGLKEDILEVKEMYRTQLNILLEEKASESVQSDDRRNSSPSDVMDPFASAVSSDSTSTPLPLPINP